MLRMDIFRRASLTILIACCLCAQASASPLCQEVFRSGDFTSAAEQMVSLKTNAQSSSNAILTTRLESDFRTRFEQLVNRIGRTEAMQLLARAWRRQKKSPELDERTENERRSLFLPELKFKFIAQDEGKAYPLSDGTFELMTYSSTPRGRLKFDEMGPQFRRVSRDMHETSGNAPPIFVSGTDVAVIPVPPPNVPGNIYSGSLQIQDLHSGLRTSIPVASKLPNMEAPLWKASPRGSYIVSIDHEGKILRLDLSTGRTQSIVVPPLNPGAQANAASPSVAWIQHPVGFHVRDDGSLIFYMKGGRWIEFDANLGEVSRGQLPMQGPIYAVEVSPDEKQAVVSSGSGSWRTELIDLASGKTVSQVSGSPQDLQVEWRENIAVASSRSNWQGLSAVLPRNISKAARSDFIRYESSGEVFPKLRYNAKLSNERGGSFASILDLETLTIIKFALDQMLVEADIKDNLASVSPDGSMLAILARESVDHYELRVYDTISKALLGSHRIPQTAADTIVPPFITADGKHVIVSALGKDKKWHTMVYGTLKAH